MGAAIYPKQYGLPLIFIGLCGIVLMVGDEQKTHRNLAVPVVPSLLLIYLFLSSIWSSDFRFTAISAFVYSGLAVGAYIASQKLTWATIISGVSLALRICIAASWAMVAFGIRSSYSVSADSGFAINGLFVHSNLFATVCVLGLITFVAEWRLGLTRRFVGPFWVLSAIFTLWLTDSRTGFVVAIFAGVASCLLLASRKSRISPVALSTLSIVALCSAVWLVLLTPLSQVSLALGRSADITGRTNIWSSVIQEIGTGTWFGTGFMAAWRSNNPATLRIWHEIGFRAAHAHNGYLDLMLQLGVVGVALIATVLVVLIYQSVRRFSETTSIVYVWVFAIGISQLIYNITETRITFAVAWLVLFLAFFKQRVSADGGLPNRLDAAVERTPQEAV